MHIARCLENPEHLYLPLSPRGLRRWLGDVGHISWVYGSTFGGRPDLEHPELFAERLDWLKLHECKLAIHAERGQGGIMRHRGSKVVTSSLRSKCRTASVTSTSMCCRKASSSGARTNHAASWSAAGRSALTAGARVGCLSACLKRYHFNHLGGQPHRDIKPCINDKVGLLTICRGVRHVSLDARTDGSYYVGFNHMPWYAYYTNATVSPENSEQWDELIRLCGELSADTSTMHVGVYSVGVRTLFGKTILDTWERAPTPLRASGKKSWARSSVQALEHARLVTSRPRAGLCPRGHGTVY